MMVVLTLSCLYCTILKKEKVKKAKAHRYACFGLVCHVGLLWVFLGGGWFFCVFHTITDMKCAWTSCFSESDFATHLKSFLDQPAVALLIAILEVGFFAGWSLVLCREVKGREWGYENSWCGFLEIIQAFFYWENKLLVAGACNKCNSCSGKKSIYL